MSPYETMPWFHYDETKGMTCSAEVRMGPTTEDIESEIQLLRDEDSEDEDEGDKGGAGSMEIPDPDENKSEGANKVEPGGRKQVLWMRAEPTQGLWDIKDLRINDQNYVNEFAEWDIKGCDFFRATIESLQMGEIPDFDELIDDKMQDESFYGGGRKGRIGRKSPNIKPGQLLGMKK